MRPALIIADEPTSALDVTVQKRILDLIDELRAECGTAVVLVTHDLGVAADRADHLVVLKGGRIQDHGTTADVLASPGSEYTRKLLADAPSLSRVQPKSRCATLRATAGDPMIVVENLVQDFPVYTGRRGNLRAVDGISFTVQRGATHAIVGESGSGKTTTARSIVGFQKPTSGRILVDGIDITSLRGDALRRFRKKIQLVYQNPFVSLDPLQSVYQIVEEPLLNFDRMAKVDRSKKVQAVLDRVDLPQSLLTRKPRALSGGQRQRVALARALVLDPQVLVLDEAVSALDVTVQAQILDLLDELQQAFGLTYLFISHDLAVVSQISDTVSVLHNGRLVDGGPVDDVFLRPGSSYTRELIAAIPGQRIAALRDTSQNLIGAGQ
jgi:peptide/nickel transport system ATP-binding protein